MVSMNTHIQDTPMGTHTNLDMSVQSGTLTAGVGVSSDEREMLQEKDGSVRL